VIGPLMKPQGADPERFMVHEYPNAAQLQKLRAAAIAVTRV